MQAKITRAGALEWAFSFGGKKDELGVDVVTDPKDNGPIVVMTCVARGWAAVLMHVEYDRPIGPSALPVDVETVI